MLPSVCKLQPASCTFYLLPASFIHLPQHSCGWWNGGDGSCVLWQVEPSSNTNPHYPGYTARNSNLQHLLSHAPTSFPGDCEESLMTKFPTQICSHLLYISGLYRVLAYPLRCRQLHMARASLNFSQSES